MERADIFAAMEYQNTSNSEDKYYAFMDGYKYAHLEMKEEMDKFTKGFAYNKNKAKDCE